MIGPWLAFSIVGLGIFYAQNLLFFPHVHLRLLALLLFYIGLRPSLPLALSLGLTLGLLQDSYAITPFGLHLGANLIVVAVARFFRRRLLVLRAGSQIFASLIALMVQEVCYQASALMLGFQNSSLEEWRSYRTMEILGTVALGPLMALLVKGVENFLRRWGWRPAGEPSPYQPRL